MIKVLTMLFLAGASPESARAAASTDWIGRAMEAVPAARATRLGDRELVLVGPPGAAPVVRFFAKPEAASDGLCRREADTVSFAADGRPVLGAPAVQISAAARCDHLAGQSFAWVQPASAEPGAIAALRSLLDAQRAARRNSLERAPQCRSELGADACAAGGSAVLAAMPLDRIFIIAPDSAPENWRFAVMPQGPGQAYWDLRMAPGEKAPAISIVWKAPAPF